MSTVTVVFRLNCTYTFIFSTGGLFESLLHVFTYFFSHLILKYWPLIDTAIPPLCRRSNVIVNDIIFYQHYLCQNKKTKMKKSSSFKYQFCKKIIVSTASTFLFLNGQLKHVNNWKSFKNN